MKWLVLFNCQAQGLGNCLSLLCPSLTVEYHDPPSIQQNLASIISRVEEFDRIIICSDVKLMVSEIEDRPNAWVVPSLGFSGYHPDLCYLSADGALSKGPAGPYHSAIAYAAFRCGLNETQAATLFCEKSYSALGYHDAWDAERNRLCAHYAHFDLDIRSSLLEWSRKGPFMHTVNHPKIFCLADIARLLLRRDGLQVLETDILPHDNLTYGPVFPVYPEIGKRLAVAGSYLFKGDGTYRLIGLDEFIHECYAVYRSTDETESAAGFFPVIRRAIEYVRDLAA